MKNLFHFFFLLPATLAAQFAPTPNWVAEQPGRVVGLVSADLNGDGREDLLGQSDKFIFWAENDPADPRGYFRHERIGPTHPDVAESLIAAADLDGDGDLDVVSGANHVVEYFPNLGQGRFEPPVQISAAQPAALEVADLSGDGLADVAATIGNDLVWFKNVAGGAFSGEQFLQNLGSFNTQFWVLDVDSDGDNDLVFNHYMGGFPALVWRENLNGQGSFAAQQSLSDRWAGSLTMADVDGDGLDDLLGIYQPQGLGWCRNDGAGSFEAVQYLGGANQQLGKIDVSDADGDGLPDVLTYSSGTAWLFRNLGGGLFFGDKVLQINGLSYAIFTDQDADGDPDIATAKFDNGQMHWLRNTFGTGIFGSPTEINVWTRTLTAMAVGDLDGDGDPDLVEGSSVFDNDPAKLSWFPSENGRFRREKSISTAHNFIQYLECVDFDKDGDLDLYLVDGAAMWYENLDGKGQFGESQPLGGLANGNDGAAADMDNDGYLDAVLSSADGKVAWFRNLHGQGGTFGPPQIVVSIFGDIEGVEPLDLNGDGNLDLAITLFGGGDKILFAMATAPGIFGTTLIDKGGIYAPQNLTKGDLDGDGKQDLVVVGFRQLAVFLSRNNFERANLGSFAFGAAAQIGDFDGDGDRDLVLGTEVDTSKIIFFEHLDGLGQFADGVKISDDNANCLTGADFDRDGDFDLAIGLGGASGGAPGGFIYWLSNGSVSVSPEPGESVSAVQIFPNPFSENLTIHPTSHEPCVFEMFDLTGRRILSAKIPGGADWQIPAARLGDGLYLYNVVSATSGRRLATGKLLKLN